MAIPPEPVQEVLPQAHWVVEAEVKEVVALGPETPKVDVPEGATSVPQKVRAQTVRLSIQRVIKGTLSEKELVVEKPVGDYALRAGNKGPFLIDASKVILGRYGPDSYSLATIEQALKTR